MSLNDNVWRRLESEAPVGERIAARLAIPELSRKLYVGFDSNKQRHLLVPLEADQEGYSDLQSRGLSIVTRELVVLGFEPKKYIDIACQDTAGYVIFDLIAAEIAEKLDTGNPKDVLSDVVSKWRRFWGRLPRDVLSFEEVTGLFAELWFLYHWLIPRKSMNGSVDGWRGPFSSRHDFEFQDKSIEVKATTMVQGRIHRIHGVEQLAPPENGLLFLYSLRLREEQGAEDNLPDFVEMCRKKLKDNIDALSKFENSLALAGYSPIHNDEYSKYKFRIVDEKLYKVANGFPRIVNESFVHGLPLGVGTLEYTINLDGYDNLCVATSPADKIEL